MKKLLQIVAIAIAATICAAAGTRSKKNSISRNLDIFSSVFKEMQTFYVDTIDADKAVATAINAMLSELDPYTVYMPKSETEEFRSISAGEFGGIGSYIMQRDGNVYVSGPHRGTPAYRAGLRHGDLIVAIDGDTMLGKTHTEVLARLKGEPGTKLHVSLRRPYAGADSVIEVDMVREKIRIPSVPYYGMLEGDGKVGYISLTSYSESTADEVRQALRSLLGQGAQSIVLDLRGNPGGLVESAVQVVGNFVPKGTEVLRTRGRGVLNEKVYKTTSSAIDTKIPLAILIDSESASASEITAGALQDLDRAVIVGDRSFGKGLVQITRDIPYEGSLKVTMARYYIPSGRLIQAIDYTHRDEEGRVTRIPDSLTNEFRTAGGRIVRDGGGITPDVKVEYPESSRLTYNIVRGYWAFDFANKYFAEHPGEVPDIATFTITDSIYEDFKRSIDPERFHYDRVCEIMLDRLRQAAKIEGYEGDSLNAQFAVLEKMLKHSLSADLDTHRKSIEPLLVREIVERYHQEPGRIASGLRFDPGIDSVRNVLTAPGRAAAILKPDGK